MKKQKPKLRYEYKGIVYRSPLEMEAAIQLDNHLVEFKYERDKFSYTIPESTHKYIPDFVLFSTNGKGHPIYLECKGGGPLYGLTDKTKLKMLLVKKTWPSIDLRFVFQNASLTTGNGKGKKSVTYGEWAELHGFPWCHKKIPNEWLVGYGMLLKTNRRKNGTDST